MTNLHQSITVDYLYELFSLRSTNYLRNNCHIDMDHLRNIDQPFKSAKVTASAHGCEELLKLDSMDFHEKNDFHIHLGFTTIKANPSQYITYQ